MRLDEIVWWDEKHQKIRLGCNSKHETLISKDPTGELKSPEEGGKFSERMPTTSVKYPQEARFCFGVAMKTNAAGVEEGIKCIPYNYTGLTILGPAEYQVRVQAELARVKSLKLTGKSEFKLRMLGAWSTPLKSMQRNIHFTMINLLPFEIIAKCNFNSSSFQIFFHKIYKH